MKQTQIIEKFREEFGIHFKGCSGELKFAESFIEEALKAQRADIIKEIEGMKSKVPLLNTQIAKIKELLTNTPAPKK